MKTAASLFSILFLISTLGLSSSALARGRSPASISPSISMEKLRGPAWNHSLHGYGNLNLSRRPFKAATKSSLIRGGDQKRQVGPLVVGNTGVEAPLSFTGPLSLLETDPSY